MTGHEQGQVQGQGLGQGMAGHDRAWAGVRLDKGGAQRTRHGINENVKQYYKYVQSLSYTEPTTLANNKQLGLSFRRFSRNPATHPLCE